MHALRRGAVGLRVRRHPPAGRPQKSHQDRQERPEADVEAAEELEQRADQQKEGLQVTPTIRNICLPTELRGPG